MRQVRNSIKEKEDLMDQSRELWADWQMDRITEKDLYSRYNNDPNLHYKITHLFVQLPEEEQEIIRLYYYEKKLQREIAEIINRSQGAVSRQLRRARARLQFLVLREPIKDEDIQNDLKNCFSPIEISILQIMLKTVNLSETSRQIKVIFPWNHFSPAIVRYRWEQMKIRLQCDEWGYTTLNHGKYLQVMDHISAHYCIMSDYYGSVGQAQHERHLQYRESWDAELQTA